MVEGEHADVVDEQRYASTSSGSVPSRDGKAKAMGVVWEKGEYGWGSCHREGCQRRCGGVRTSAPASCVADRPVRRFLMMVTCTYRNDTVDDMDIKDEGGGGDRSPARATNSKFLACECK